MNHEIKEQNWIKQLYLKYENREKQDYRNTVLQDEERNKKRAPMKENEEKQIQSQFIFGPNFQLLLLLALF